MSPKDLFSQGSVDYARYRPRYPTALFKYLAGLCRERKTAWDCATGNGQAANELARDFETVAATDISQKQLDQAPATPNVRYSVASAEASGLAASSVDLVTVAQAFHWFRHDSFYEE